MKQVVFDLVLEFFDDLVELFNAGGWDDLGVVEEFLHEVVVVEFAAGCFFFLLWFFFSSLVLCRLCVFFFLLLLGLDDLDSFLLGPLPLLQFCLEIDGFLFCFDPFFIGGEESFAVIYQERAVIDLLLISIDLLPFLSLLILILYLSFFLLVTFFLLAFCLLLLLF